MDSNDALTALLGGLLIGLGAAIRLLFRGQVAGISGILGGVLELRADAGSRAWFLAGMLLTGLLLAAVFPAAFGASPVQSPLLLVAAGLLVGFGTRLGHGCTSGHGICGVSRGALRSVVATSTFMAAGILMVLVVRAASAAGAP